MKTFTIELTQDSLLVISNALVEMPYKVAAPIITDINKQLDQLDQESEKGSE